MDDVCAQLTARIIAESRRKWPRVLLVGIAGPPGSGKTTVATKVTDLLNTSLPRGESKVSAMTISLDGFHLSRQQLLDLPDPEFAMLRRGAPWTFNVSGIVAFVQTLRENADLPADLRLIVEAPSFDHAIKDPIENDIVIPRDVEVIILEHNYLLLNQRGWRDVAAMLDLKILVDVDAELARRRVALRHIHSGIESSLTAAYERFDQNDRLNGDLIRSCILQHDVRVESVHLG